MENRPNPCFFQAASPAGRLIACLLSVLLLSGCVTLADPEASQENNAAVVAFLQPGHSLGQSFISRRSGLNSISVWLNLPPEQTPLEGVLTAYLYHSPQDAAPLRKVDVPFLITSAPSPVTLPFEPVHDPPGQSYYVTLQVQGSGLQALGRAEDAYSGGTAYQDAAPQPFDLAFSTSYRYSFSELLVDAGALLRSAWLVIPLGLVLLLPGWLLLRGLHLNLPGGFSERIALSLGLSLASIPVVLTWTSALGLHWKLGWVWFVFGLLCAAAILPVIVRLTSSRRPGAMRALASTSPDDNLPTVETPFSPAHRTSHIAPVLNALRTPHLALIMLFAITLAARLIMVRDLATPPWVDSVHHAVLTRLILEQGAYPASYLPYINIDTASYHAGFHALLAAFVWLSRLPLQSAMLLFGQVLNALIIFPVYLLTVRYTRQPLAGVFAALLAGLFTPMPAYYTSWGRYTQLASLLILPAAFSLLQDLSGALHSRAKSPAPRREVLHLAVLAALACAGLFLTHYRVAVFLASLLLADFTVRLVATWARKDGLQPLVALRAYAITGLLALLLALPWLPGAFATLFVPKMSAWAGGNPEMLGGFTPSYLTTAWGIPAMNLARIGLVWGLLRRKSFPITLALWCGLLLLSANLEPLGLPGGGFITNLSVAITLFFPIAVAGGFFIGDLLAWLESRLQPGAASWLRLAWGAAFLVVALFAAQVQIPILRPITFLTRQADLPAIQWASEHIPPGETVLVNPVGWGYGFYQGQDGGYWLGPLAGRPTIPPPVLYGLDNDPERAERINQLSRRVIELHADPPSLYRLLEDNGILYIYLGVRGGILSPELLEKSDLFEPIYASQGAWVFKRIPQ